MVYKKVKQLLSELQFNPCKKVVQQLGQEAVPRGRDFFCPCKKTACFNQVAHSVTLLLFTL